MHRVVVLLGTLVLLGACAGLPRQQPSPAETRLIDAIARRLEIAREVAWIKYLDGRPVRDPRREAVVLDSITAQAAARGLDPATVQKFFAAQIAASCAQQERWIYLWQRGAPLPSYAPRDLRSGVREDIDLMNEDLLAALARIDAHHPGLRARAEHGLRRRGFCPRAVALATAPL